MSESASPDPVLLELYRHRFSGIAEEMGVTLRRTAFSPNIKERLDFSCALFDGEGNLLAQAAHIPVHLGAMPASVAAALAAFDHWAPGDLAILNDPFQGGTHLPDITMISPVFLPEGESLPAHPRFFLASRAHHADVGGMSPGSMPLSTEVYQEGIIIPPLKLDEAGRCNEALLALLLRNVRTPEERRGDLAAQRAAHATGARRLQELVARHGLEEVQAYGRQLRAYSERLTRAAIRSWPEGEYEAEDVLEIDGGLAPIRVRATIDEEEIRFDFAGSSPALPSSMNAVLAITRSACWYAVRCLVGEEVPVNGGCFAPVKVIAPKGSVIHAQPPAAVAGGNVETSQRIVDVVFAALARALPGAVAAAGQGTMNNLTIGGLDRRAGAGRPFAYYETIGGGMGAHPEGDGLSGVHVHMSNTLNTPVEALERAYPFRLRCYALRQGSGGAGRWQGGDGVVREYEMLVPCTVTMLSERRQSAPYGLAGGQAGQPGRNFLLHLDGTEEELPAKFSRQFLPGERLRVETPGGGGWGR